jgi:hypothetical protein
MTGQRSCFLQSVCKSRSANKVQNRKESLKSTGSAVLERKRFCVLVLHVLPEAGGGHSVSSETGYSTDYKKNRNSAIQVSEKMAF